MSTNQHNVGERLREARKAAGYEKPSDAARAIGIPEPTYLGHENGSRGLSRAATRYADFFRVRLDWLLNGKGHMRENRSGNSAEISRQEEPTPFKPVAFGEERLAPREMVQDVPILGSAACGEDGLFEFNGEILGYARRPPKLVGSTKVYALLIANDSMFPWRKHGGLVYAHPGWPVRIDDFVVVQMNPKRPDVDPRPPAYVKQLIRQNSEGVTLHQFNPAKDISLKRREIKSIHRIVDWDDLLGL